MPPVETALDLSPAAADVYLAATVENPEFPGDRELLGDLASEARLALRLLRRLGLTTASRVLEVGAGAGIIAAFLHRQGATITPIEPLNEGFEELAGVHGELAARVAVPEVLPIPAAELEPDVHGTFDVVFSVNVVEHMHPLDENLDAMARVLAPGGAMIHTCPNYRVPYEPHVRVPLVPGRPALTARLLPSVRRDPLWPTLNWVTAGDVRRFARRHGLALEFERRQFATAVARLAEDAAFARRQRRIARALRVPGIVRALSLLPPEWSTPMTFVARRP